MTTQPLEDVLVAPSILSANFLDLGGELDDIATADLVHYDVMDGHFVPNLTFGPDILRQVKERTKLPIDAHLMIANPDVMAVRYLEAGADIVCFHLEATVHAHRLVQQIKSYGAKAAIAINPATPVSSLEAIIDDLDMVLVMTVNPGFGGQSFIEGSISYHDVHFSYEEETGASESPEVIRGLNLDIRPGETIALVGASGGGKSTTCALLPRFYDVDSGSITIDGQDVRSVTQRSLREAIGIVQQEVYLFDGTIAENIAYGNPRATMAQIEDAAEKANIAEFIETLPDGYETQVGERGARLSGGQKQRIAIARVFLKDPKILILDEATSALDNESEHAVQESLAELSQGRTTIVIAHRLSTIKDADEIATIDAGRVAERGTHDELLARGGTYARYYRMQFEGARA